MKIQAGQIKTGQVPIFEVGDLFFRLFFFSLLNLFLIGGGIFFFSFFVGRFFLVFFYIRFRFDPLVMFPELIQNCFDLFPC